MFEILVPEILAGEGPAPRSFSPKVLVLSQCSPRRAARRRCILRAFQFSHKMSGSSLSSLVSRRPTNQQRRPQGRFRSRNLDGYDFPSQRKRPWSALQSVTDGFEISLALSIFYFTCDYKYTSNPCIAYLLHLNSWWVVGSEVAQCQCAKLEGFRLQVRFPTRELWCRVQTEQVTVIPR